MRSINSSSTDDNRKNFQDGRHRDWDRQRYSPLTAPKMIHLTSRPLKPDALSKKLSRIGSKEQKHRNAHRITLAGVWFLTLVAIASLGLMTQLTLASGHAPKLKLASLVHFDTGNKYYTTMIEGIKHNFKQTIKKASQRLVSSMGNVTFSKPIRLVGPKSVDRPNKRQRVTIEDLQIEGINNPKVLSVHFDEQYLKLHVVFKLKSIRVSGRCVSRLSKKRAKQQLAIGQQPKQQQRQLLMEAKNWKAAWSASVMKIIGRDHFDSAGVHSSHSEPRKLSWNLNGCPEVFHEQLRLALIDRVRTSIDRRLIDIMETVMIPMDSAPIDDPVASLEDDKSRPVGKRGRDWDENQEAKPDFGQLANRRVDQLAERKWTQSSTRRLNPLLDYLSHSSYANGDDGDNGRHKLRRKSLRRTKRQAPCEQGEDLDDYVDQLFRFGTKIVQGMEPVSAPNTTIELPDYNLKIFLYDGKGTRFYKFKRAKTSWVYCSNETVSLGITIEVEEVRVAYKYRVISGTRLLFDGDLEARLSPRLQAQLSQAIQEEDSMERVQQRIDRIRIFRLGRVFVIIRGLGNLTQSLSMLINSYLNDNQQELQPLFRMIERDALPMLNKRLERVAVGILGGDF